LFDKAFRKTAVKVTLSFSFTAVILTSIIIGPAFSPVATAEAATVTIDGSIKYQTIDGFGGSGAYYESWLKSLQEPARTNAANLLFSDLGTSIFRLRTWTGIEPLNDDDDTNNFNWAAFNFNTDLDQVWTAQQARDRGVTKFISSVWSPPGWMKDNGQETNGGHLRTDMYDEFAEWLAAYVIGYKTYHNITIGWIGLQNEPNFVATYESCEYTPEEMRDVIKVVGAKFEAEGITTKIVVPETTGSSNAPDYLSTIMADPDAAKYVDVFANHLYEDHIATFFNPDPRIPYLQAVAALGTQYDKPIWQTEYSLLSGSEQGTFREALYTAYNIHNFLTYGNGSAYLVWGLFWISSGSGQGLIAIPSYGASSYTITPKFYAVKQYFKFISPGLRRIEAASDNPNVLVSAYVNETDGNVTIVAINKGSSSITTTFSLGNVSVAAFNQYRTSDSENCAYVGNILVSIDSFNVNLPAESITTFVSTVPLEHELDVSLEAPSYLEPGGTSLLNATVYNRGLSNETAELFLMINGTVVNSTSITELVSGTSYTISHIWTPTDLGTYNVTTYAPPVSGENYTYNNRATRLVSVTYPLIHPIEGQWAKYDLSVEFGGTTYTSEWNFTYDHYVSLHLINITIEVTNWFEPTGWIAVNTMNRLVESGAGAGSFYVGTWYFGLIETSITLGSTVNLMSGEATVVGSRIIKVGEHSIDCWELSQESGGSSYTYWYDKETGLVIDEEWTGQFSGKMTLNATNIPIGTAGVHDLAVISVTPDPTEATIGENVTITVIVENNGSVAETFNVTVYYNATAIDTQPVTYLAAGSNKTLTFTWNTTSVEAGDYTIKAVADTVTGETNTANNELTANETVTVREQRVVDLIPWLWIGVGVVVAVIIIAAAYMLTRKKP
jgi:glucuronoarabinoxylan endo-1,4-beta-xylanase